MSSISVVITTRDDRLTLRDCLDGVLGSGVPVTEVLVVDRGSLDGTADIVRRAGAPVRLLELPGSSSSQALAAGQADATGDILTVVPSRALVGAGAIASCVTAAAANDGRAATVDLRPVGTTAFGRAAAAIVGSTAHRVEARRLHGKPAEGPSDSPPARRSSYLVADTPAALAAEAVGPRPGWQGPASAAMVVTAGSMAVFGRGWLRVAVPLGHAATSAVRAVRAGRDPGVAPHRAFLAAEVWDWSTGVGRCLAALRRLGGQR